MSEFCHLHCHTQYSLLDGAARIDKLIARAGEMGHTAVAITDHGNLYGVPEFYTGARKAGLTPVVGCEFYVTPSGMGDVQDRTRYHQVLLAKNAEGYRNLIRLSSQSYTDGYYYKPRIDKDTLRAHSAGLVASTCCLQGEVLQTILKKGEAAGRAVFEEYLDIFGRENYFVEVQDHAIPEQRQCNAVLVRWAKEYGVRVVATNDVHYIEQADAEAQDVLLCLQTGKSLDTPGRMKFENDQFYFKSADQMRGALAPGLADGVFENEAAVDAAIRASAEVADQCRLEIPMGQLLMPHFPIPAPHDGPDAYLRHLTYEGARARYADGAGLPAHVAERLDYELATISDMGFAGYFLIVQDFTTAARTLGVSVGPGRGSAAGSAVAYCLGITNIDPLAYDLLFERFLNPERVSMPDIDIDFDDRGRGKVIDYVVQKYGRESVCQIVTFGTMGAKSVLRDVARVIGVPLSEADRIAKLVPDGVKVSLSAAQKEVKEFAELYRSPDPNVRRLMHYATVLEGSARHTGVHAAGVIIAPGRVGDFVPVAVQKGKAGAPDTLTTQYDGRWIEDFGLLKMDFLGLKTLTILDDALALVRQTHGVEIDLDQIPLDDPETYTLFQRGDTVAIFQFESSGMREWMRKLKPTCLDDLIAMNALYRPGPMDLIPTYIERKHGRETVEYPHPMLEPILKPTYGIPVYQEQVMEMARTMGGYTLGGADLLRRAMGKKDMAKMAKEKDTFVAGAVEKGVDEKTAGDVFDMMAKFAGYGFNKCAHAQTKVTLPDGSRMTLARAFREQPTDLMAMWPDGEIRPHRVARIVKTGRKPLMKVTTSSGRVIKVTAEHRLLTTEGYLPVSDMQVGTELMTAPRPVSGAQRAARRDSMRRLNRTPEQRERASARMTAYQAARPHEDKAEHMRRMHTLHPDLTRAGTAAMHERIKWLHANDPAWHKAQMERTLASVRAAYDSGPGFGLCSVASNGMWCASRPERDMCEWLVEQGVDFEMHKVLANGRICDFYFAGIYWEMDGMDRADAYFADKYGDLPYVVVTPEDFRAVVARHLALDHAENGDPIVSIEPCGDGITYDVEMAPDGPLNFIANGIVSHNSHSAAYSVVAYQTAYLKAHYPAEFMAAVLTTEMADSAKLAVALEATRAAGQSLLPPCVNASDAHFTVENGQIRFGLGAIKGVGAGAIEALLAARAKAGGRFADLFEVVRELDLRSVGKKTLEALAQAGALDSFDGHRAQLVAAVDTAWGWAQKQQADRAAGQSSLFGGDGADAHAYTPPLPVVAEWTRGEALRHERDLIGFYVSGHPLDDFAAETAAFASIRLGDGANVPHESDQTVIGMITEVQHRTTKSGRPMAYATIEDATGAAEAVFFAQTLERAAPHLVPDTVVMIRAKAETGRGDLKLLAREVLPMWKVRESLVKAVVLRVDADAVSADDVEAIGALCDAHRGACKLYFDLTQRDLPRPVRLRARTAVVDLTPDFLKGVAAIIGREAVVLEGE